MTLVKYFQTRDKAIAVKGKREIPFTNMKFTESSYWILKKKIIHEIFVF